MDRSFPPIQFDSPSSVVVVWFNDDFGGDQPADSPTRTQ